jgi:hypothetical protein
MGGAIRLDLGFGWYFLGDVLRTKMRTFVFALALLGTFIAVSPLARSATVVVQEYNWDHPYWHHHHYGYWHHHRGYWVYRHGAHVFINVD